MVRPRVLFVSKPIVRPFNDGSRSIVVGLASHCQSVRPVVMTTREVLELPGVEGVAVYRGGGSYAPLLSNNVRAAAYLALRSHAELWHFVFAPNPASSGMGRLLRRMRRRPIVQTVASRPRVFDDPASVLFGDRIVAQSKDTLQKFVEGWERAGVPESARTPMCVIPPPLGEVRVPTLRETHAVRRELDVGDDVPLVLYPGDLETSRGAERMVRAVSGIMAGHPSAVVVFAYRDKTRRALPIAEDLASRLPPARVRLVREARDILALIRTSAVLAFPVDDLFGKVDIPIVLLEAMELGTPVVVTDEGPLAELVGPEHVAPDDELALVGAILGLIGDYGRRSAVVDAQRRELQATYQAERVTRQYESLYGELLVPA